MGWEREKGRALGRDREREKGELQKSFFNIYNFFFKKNKENWVKKRK